MSIWESAYLSPIAELIGTLWKYGIALLTSSAKLLLFYQPNYFSSTMQTINDETKFIKFLIRDAKLKLKLSLVLLPLAIVTVQIFSNVHLTSSLFGVAIYMNVLTLFLSIALHVIAMLFYEAILHNPAGLNAWILRARGVVNMPLKLDPWVVLSLPSIWTFSAFFLFFIALILTGLETINTTEANHSSRSWRKEALGSTIVIVSLGLMNSAALIITWQKYIHMQ